jgi:hypothetical protein
MFNKPAAFNRRKKPPNRKRISGTGSDSVRDKNLQIRKPKVNKKKKKVPLALIFLIFSCDSIA